MFPQIQQSERIISFDVSDQYSAALLGNLVSAGVIQYHYVLLVVNKLGGPPLYVASEWSAWYPERKSIPVLGVFFKGDHTNIKDDAGLIDEHIFILQAIETARQYLGLKYVKPTTGELWGITGVMNKIGDRRRVLNPPAPLPEVKYFFPFFGFSEEIKEYVEKQESTKETENLRAKIVDCLARFTFVAKSEDKPARPALRLVRDAKILDSFEVASAYAKQMASNRGLTFSVTQTSIGWLANEAIDTPAECEPCTARTSDCGPTWVQSDSLWIGRHKTIGLIVVIDHLDASQYEFRIYILNQDRMADVVADIICERISNEEITDFEVELALLGYGTYLRMCWPFPDSPRPPKHTCQQDDSDNEAANRSPSGLDPPEEWDSADGWSEYGGLERSDNH